MEPSGSEVDGSEKALGMATTAVWLVIAVVKAGGWLATITTLKLVTGVLKVSDRVADRE